MVKMEETVRDLRDRLKNNRPQEDTAQQPIERSPSDDLRIEELQKANAILSKSKESHYKKSVNQAAKYEKKLEKMNEELEQAR